MKKDYYVASISYGKDSLAMLIKIIELGYPLDEVIFCEVMFNDEISGIHPRQLEFINNARKILKDKYNIEVHHLKAEKPFTIQFYTKKQKENEDQRKRNKEKNLQAQAYGHGI